MANAPQLDVLLYPYHALAPLPDFGQPNPRAVETAATLLYFDTVTLGRLGDPKELGLPSPEDALEEVDRIKERHGADAVRAFNQAGKFVGLTVGEIATLCFVRYWYELARFHKYYAPLIEAGVVRPVSLAAITEDARLNAEFTNSTAERWLNMNAALAGFVAYYDDFKGWPKDDAEAKTFAAALGDADGPGLTGWYLRKILSETNPKLLQNTEQARQGEFFRESFLLDIHHQTLLSTLLRLPVVSFDEAHLGLRGGYAAKLLALHGEEAAPPDREALAVRLVAETLTQMPVVMPRSPAAILELRRDLAEELEEFRHGIRNVATDLAQASGPVTQKQIEYSIEKNFARALDKLSRRLAHPNRDMLRNLVTTPAVISGGVSFTLGLVSTGQNLLSLFLGAAAAVLSAATKTWVDRKKEEEQSGIAFLVKASVRNR
ncbi:MAG: hypothetical protein ABSG53_28565 [Thermoguttaceae bacterium]|jgi:hypothetical protein